MRIIIAEIICRRFRARELYVHDWSLSGHCPSSVTGLTIPKYGLQ